MAPLINAIFESTVIVVIVIKKTKKKEKTNGNGNGVKWSEGKLKWVVYNGKNDKNGARQRHNITQRLLSLLEGGVYRPSRPNVECF